MTSVEKSLKGIEKRNFKRLDGTYPIEFTIDYLQGGLPGIGWEQAYTRNISKTGMCLETAYLDQSTIKYLHTNSISLKLRINIPPSQPPIKAVAEVKWYKEKLMKEEEARYVLGLHFTTIAKSDLVRMYRYTDSARFLSQSIVMAGILLCGLVLLMFLMFTFRIGA